MQHITEISLNDLPTRIQYLRDFIGFNSEDAAALHTARDVVAPLVPTVVDVVYEKLLSFDITAKSFIPRQTGFTGETPTKLSDLNAEAPQIKFRKDFLANYLVKLVTMDYSKEQSWEYLDKVGLMHTGKTGFAHRVNKPALRVELIHCSILLGYVEDILVNAVITHPDLDLATKNAVARAANKIIWIQNDLFARHYVTEQTTATASLSQALTYRLPSVIGFGAILFLSGVFWARRFS
ncbi:hypothetical protein HYPSUDRAFT_548829 [Hypholoma sublateritium FD-334 SS-4]|uniref:Globin-sensor domain-containing protein n=1 Tax=Hypholoma sublateritium (strain FD-334 SS-4) TaxID=945553 RepID=A0A0D2P5P8_HYPSF|nr:hypothetical protein HYPSUDRAFT_548829 [Hypholoma sublateritium FD-334 SS-4]